MSEDRGVVIASKILHFWHAELAPMIDVNVAKAWKDLTPASLWADVLSASGDSEVLSISESPTIEEYLSYWEFAYRLRQFPGGPTYRNLDQRLFFFARDKATS
jgi:hypothetical protein